MIDCALSFHLSQTGFYSWVTQKKGNGKHAFRKKIIQAKDISLSPAVTGE